MEFTWYYLSALSTVPLILRFGPRGITSKLKKKWETRKATYDGK